MNTGGGSKKSNVAKTNVKTLQKKCTKMQQKKETLQEEKNVKRKGELEEKIKRKGQLEANVLKEKESWKRKS